MKKPQILLINACVLEESIYPTGHSSMPSYKQFYAYCGVLYAFCNPEMMSSILSNPVGNPLVPFTAAETFYCCLS